jgi:hypothetical protein
MASHWRMVGARRNMADRRMAISGTNYQSTAMRAAWQPELVFWKA